MSLETGSTVIAPAGPAWCVTGGYTVVLTLDADADAADVVRRYAEQFEAFGFDGETTAGTFEERPYLAARHSAAGGGELEVVALDDDPRLLLLSAATTSSPSSGGGPGERRTGVWGQ